MNKEEFWTTIFMIPWAVLVVLFFIWANKGGFSLSKTAFGVLLTTGSSILWYSIARLFAELFIED